MPQAEIKQSWFLPEKTKNTPQEDTMPNSPDQKGPKPQLNAWSQAGMQTSTRSWIPHPDLTMTEGNPDP